MTDTTELPPIATAPTGLSAETMTAAAALYAKNGYSEDAIKAAGYAPAAPTAPVIDTKVQVTQVPGSNTAVMSSNGINREQAIQAARNLLHHGVNVDTVAEAALAHGLEPKDFMTEPASKEAVEAQVREGEVAKGFELPPDGSYHLHYDPNFAQANGEDDVGALAEINRDFEAGFKAAGVPAARRPDLGGSHRAGGGTGTCLHRRIIQVRLKRRPRRGRAGRREPRGREEAMQ